MKKDVYYYLLSILDSWNNSFFITGDYRKATGLTLLIERPVNYDQDGEIIEQTFAELKNLLKSGLLCKGIYNQKKELLDIVKRKPVKVHTIISGIPFPISLINKLKEDAELTLDTLDVDVTNYLSYASFYEPQIEVLDFSVFKN